MAKKKDASADKGKQGRALAEQYIAEQGAENIEGSYISPQDFISKEWDAAGAALDAIIGRLKNPVAIPEKLIKEYTETLGEKEAAAAVTNMQKQGALLARIRIIDYILEYIRDPDKTILDNGGEGNFAKYILPHYVQLAFAVHKKTGGDMAQILDPNTRTEEQKQALYELTGEEQKLRLQSFLYSNFMQAAGILSEETCSYTDSYFLNRYAAIYFFAMHYEEIKPQDAQGLQEEQIAELKSIFHQLDAFFSDKEKTGSNRRAIELFAEFVLKHDPDKFMDNLPRIFGGPPEKLSYPVDKINATVWRNLERAARNGSGQIEFAMEKRGSSKEATAYYSINFDELEKETGIAVSQKLTAFDKRVYVAVYAISRELKTNIMSVGQIYVAMGNKGQPAPNQTEKINESLTKMGMARVYLDNTEETTVNKGYTTFKYDGPLLPFERVSAYINGGLSNAAIHILSELPLMRFARERNQITTIERKLLETPLNQTVETLGIEDYLLERIAKMKNPKDKSSKKMLYSTIFEKCGITEKKQKSRAPEKIAKILNHYMNCGFIKSYSQTAEGVEIEP